jgi:hypothetical protein
MAQRSIADKILWLVSRTCLAGGLGSLAVGFGFAAWTGIFLARSISVPGKIIRLNRTTNQEDGAINFLPVVTFTAADGHVYTIDSGVATNPPEFDVDEKVSVRYVKSNPGSARIASFLQLWFVSIVCSGLGVFYGVPGYFLFRWERKRSRRNTGFAPDWKFDTRSF